MKILVRVVLAALAALFVTVGAVHAADWNAYAIDANGTYGHGVASTRARAQDYALEFCGNSKCRVVQTFKARCAALADSFHQGYWYGAGSGATKSAARSNAMDWCAQSAPASTCKLKHSYCQ